MSLFALILLGVFLWLVVRPLLRVYMAIRRATSRGFNANPYDDYRTDPGRRGGWSAPQRRRKKIDPSVGEYVSFEEVKISETTSTRADSSETSTYTTTEAQVTDAEWEEIP